ncbi:MAG: DUF167 domain-containing protein [Dehalococcoidia bacterium]
MRLKVRLIPRASRDAIAGFDASGNLRIRVTAPPVNGAANAAMLKLVARRLRLAPTSVVLVQGAASRTKVLDVPLDEEAVRSRLSH